MSRNSNPFNITKAVDFSDSQILDYWVDLSGGNSFVNFLRPTSPMPMFVLGGKGSGKTHVMRYFSFACQQLRHKDDVKDGILKDRYLGVYFRCSGINAARFAGKNVSDEIWDTAFAYFVELWLAQLLLENIQCSGLLAEDQDLERRFTAGLVDLLHMPEGTFTTVAEFRKNLKELQREIDLAVDNAALSEEFSLQIRISRGRLIFGIPRLLRSLVKGFEECLVVFLIDEFENLDLPQQRYINTLVREKEEGSTFKIGARLFGVRTYRTLSADEENKEGSEFDTFYVDKVLRTDEKSYSRFASRLVSKRLLELDLFDAGSGGDGQSFEEMLSGYFQEFSLEELTSYIIENFKRRERPWISALRERIESGRRLNVAVGVSGQDDVRILIQRLRVADNPILEKHNIFMLYRGWSVGADLMETSQMIQIECMKYLDDPDQRTRYGNAFSQFKGDLVAQILREINRPQRYLGFKTLVAMSWGLPRNLLILLKNIYAWAEFRGEAPFSGGTISVDAQQLGVQDSANWFFEDARSLGRHGHLIQAGIARLATLLRTIRFSDKPSECSPSTFSCDVTRISPRAYEIIKAAEKWSLLIQTGRRRERNSKRIKEQYQLNRMLAPSWDLPIRRRGVPELNPLEVEAIFFPSAEGDFDRILALRRARMTAPQFGRTRGSNEEGGLFQEFY